MNRSFFLVSQELIKELLNLPEDVLMYASEYVASNNAFKFYYTGPVAIDVPEGTMTPEHNPFPPITKE